MEREQSLRLVKQFAGTVLLGAPAGATLAFLSTPLLWRLEQIVPVELAGHSGPAEWVLGSGACIASVLLFFCFRKVYRNQIRPPA